MEKLERKIVTGFKFLIKRIRAFCEGSHQKRLFLAGKYITLTAEQASRYDELERLRLDFRSTTRGCNRRQLKPGINVST